MSETKKLTIVGIVLAVLFAISIGVYILDKNGKINFGTKASTSSKYELYYLGREGCGYCQLFQPVIDSVKEKYGIDYIYIDIQKITSEELANYLERFNVNPEKFGTPTIALEKDGKFVANNIGYIPEQELYNFLKKNGAITGEYISDYPNLTYIDFDDYKEIANSDAKQFIVIAQEGCAGCDEAQEYLNTVAANNFKVNYYNVSFKTEEDFDYFYESYDYIKHALDAEELYTPTFMVVENKTVVDTLSQFESEEELEAFLKKNGLIK